MARALSPVEVQSELLALGRRSRNALLALLVLGPLASGLLSANALAARSDGPPLSPSTAAGLFGLVAAFVTVAALRSLRGRARPPRH